MSSERAFAIEGIVTRNDSSEGEFSPAEADEMIDALLEFFDARDCSFSGLIGPTVPEQPDGSDGLSHWCRRGAHAPSDPNDHNSGRCWGTRRLHVRSGPMVPCECDCHGVSAPKSFPDLIQSEEA